MLIDDENIRVQYDSTAESPIMAGDPLPLPFKFVEKIQVHAILSDDTELIINQDYTVGYPEEEEPDEDESLVMTDNMVVILNIDIPVGETITIYRETTLDQTSEFPQEARFSSRKIEDALDKLTMQNQEQRESLARALKLPLNAPIDIGNLALPNPEPNRSVKWNGQGTALVNTEFDPDTALVTTENYKNQALTAATGAAKSEAEAIKQATDAKNAAKLVNDNIQSALDKSDSLLNMSRVLPMFTPIWSDHTLNDASFLRADTFSWHSGKIYEAGYETLVTEYNKEECVTETEAGVTYKRTPSGFKIASLDQHENVLNAFTSTGKSWFYVLDTEQQRFKLPRTQYSFTGIRDAVGGSVEAGLPSLLSNSTGAHTHTRGTMNIKGGFVNSGMEGNFANAVNGAFVSASYSYTGYYHASGRATWLGGFDLDASKNWTGATSSNGAHSHTITDSAGVLGKANTVQPPATQMYLYFFVGNYNRPQTDINIGELVEIVNNRDFEGQIAEGNEELIATKNQCIKEIQNYNVANLVQKTGDTMTGHLDFEGTASIGLFGGSIYTHSSMYAYGDTVSTARYECLLQHEDKNKVRKSRLESVWGSDGSHSVNLSEKKNASENSFAVLSVGWDKNGKTYTSAPTPATGDNSTNIATTAYCVNMRCTSKATTTSSASTTRPCWVVQNYVSGTSWYRVWSDGWIEQGGQHSNVGTNSTYTVTFLKAFSNTNYTLTYVDCEPGTGDINPGYVQSNSWTTTSFGYRNSTGTVKKFSWYACGY